MSGSDETMVVLTGCGWVTPLVVGNIEEVTGIGGASGGVNASGKVEAGSGEGDRPEASGDICYRGIPDGLRDEHPGLSKELQRDRGAWITAVALTHACRDASLNIESLDETRVGMVLGSAFAGQLGMIAFANEVREQSARFVSPIHFPQTVGNYISGALARSFRIRGPSATVACGSASGLDAIVEACALIAAGSADVVYAGGAEPLSEALARGLDPSTEPPTEGACLFVLERASHAAVRGARPLATVTSWGSMTVNGSAHGTDGALNASGDEEEKRETCGTGESARAKARGSRGDRRSARAKARGSGVVSVAGFRRGGAVFIEHWIGRCLGASGAAAVAAAVAAANGRAVPLVDESDSTRITIGRVAHYDQLAAARDIPATIIAATDYDNAVTLEVMVHSQGVTLT